MKGSSYFQSYEDYFWQWEDDGEVIAIPHSSTIAYKDFLVEVLEKLAVQGIPPFGSLLLVIIATNPNGETTLNDVYAILSKKQNDSNSSIDPLPSAISFLKLLSQLPAIYKKGNNRILLMQTLFDNCHNKTSALYSKQLLKFYKAYKLEEDILIKKSYSGDSNNDLKVISLLARRFPDIKTIMEKMADLPLVEEELTLPNDDEKEPGEKDFPDDLIDNDQTFQVGALIKRLWSGLNIPYHNYLPSQQPIGGVSDLTNKGEFDRLLISEFANDDLVFLSRLANNEALYFNREIPPQNNDLERIILIDVSIKNWGTPKTIAHALMLAIVKHPKTNIHCSAFAIGNDFQPLNFGTIDEIITGLQVLEPCLHSAQGLDLFFKEYKLRKKAEIFFICSKDAFRHPGFYKTLSDHYASFNYWIQVDHLGNIDLYKRQQSSKKHIQHILLPLEELWKKKTTSVVSNESGHLNYPILFQGSPNPKKMVEASDGRLFLMTSEKNLLRSYDKERRRDKGWELIAENLSFTEGEVAVGLSSSGDYLFLVFNMPNREITILNLTTREKKRAFFHEWVRSVYSQFLFYDDCFYYSSLGYPSRHWTFELNDQIVVKSFENIPKVITDLYKEEENKKKQDSVLHQRTILKNVTSVFINEVNNLVLNIHELKLTNNNIIKLEKTAFKIKSYEAVCLSRTEFQFADGSLVTINRSGMMILRSSDPSIPVIYVPTVLEGMLGIASETEFSGNPFYQPENTNGSSNLSAPLFWEKYMDPFINNIKSYGTKVKTLL